MRTGRWIEHLPPWAALGAVLGTGAFDPLEGTLMAAPMAFAAGVAALRVGLGRWSRVLEIVALLMVLGVGMLRLGLLTTALFTLFLLSALRLALPPSEKGRRQVLLCSFLALLATSVTNLGPGFLVGLLAWAAATEATLLRHAWEEAAHARRLPPPPPPFRQLLPWTLAASLLGGLLFLALPRTGAGLRVLPWGLAGLGGGARAGLSDRLSLGKPGPIASAGEVALRLSPLPRPEPARQAAQARALALLPAIRLERLEGLRWEADASTPPRHPHPATSTGSPLDLEILVSPSPQPLLALPYGRLALQAEASSGVRQGPGGSLRWTWPTRAPGPLRVQVLAEEPLLRQDPGGRRPMLLRTGRESEAARRWSLSAVPRARTSRELAEGLEAALGAFRYTLDNPSGRAANPLADFLERSRAGHCEYFASALALALRHRAVPARVVTGYRLGPWIEEGGYWIVTDREAHAWVEYWDKEAGRWRVSDPTPAAPPSAFGGEGVLAGLRRWSDTLEYRWNCHVVRYSGEDQTEALQWLQGRITRASALPCSAAWAPALLGVPLALALLLRAWHRRHSTQQPGVLAALRPLVKRASRTHPPLPGETARAWLARLAAHRPERRQALEALAERADATAYGVHGEEDLAARARREARFW